MKNKVYYWNKQAKKKKKREGKVFFQWSKVEFKVFFLQNVSNKEK